MRVIAGHFPWVLPEFDSPGIAGREAEMKKQNVEKTGKSEPTVKQFAARAIRLYKAGKRVSDIAVALGYERGHGQNRVAAALVKAGIYKGNRKAKTGPKAAA